MAGGRRAGGGRAAKTGRPRRARVRLRTAKGRKPSSVRWLRRQLDDPYVAEARRRGYRSRAAWKLIDIDDRFGLLRAGAHVVDLGAAPGGWTQVAVERVRASSGEGRVVAVDLREMPPLAGAELLRLDLSEPAGAEALACAVGAGCDVVVSDMAAPATGHRPTDRIRNGILAERACALAVRLLRPGGALAVKAFHGGGAAALMAPLKRDFAEVRTFKPAASRSESDETYVVARGFGRRGCE